MVTISATPPPLLQQPTIDMRFLSQSELQTLSLSTCSTTTTAAAAAAADADFIFPRIDRSIFNESAGSRRQTYSRPPKPPSTASITSTSTSPAGHHHRNRLPGLLPTPKPPPVPTDDPELLENRSIVDHLKQFLSQNPDFPQIVEPSAGKKRKRGRNAKAMESTRNDGIALGVFNRKGVRIDLEALAGAVDPFGEELRRRTEGMSGEMELLEFLSGLEGEWGSSRKKRKIVDAGMFGDVLPVGWRVLLGLRRREGRASVYCRRYVSPNGQHFISCKEVASYLQSQFGLKDTHRESTESAHYIHPGLRHATIADKDESSLNVIGCSTIPVEAVASKCDGGVNLLGLNNLVEVEVRDLFECHKCNLTFSEKDAYLEHLLSLHEGTTRKYRLGSSTGDHVIMKDGKYECQFCHKVFSERHCYCDHVRIHEKNQATMGEETSGQGGLQNRTEPITDALHSGTSKMDALIEIAHNSIVQNPMFANKEEALVSTHREPNGMVVDSSKKSYTGEEINSGCKKILVSEARGSENECIFPALNGSYDSSGFVEVKISSIIDSDKEQNLCRSGISGGEDGQALTDAINPKIVQEKGSQSSNSSTKKDIGGVNNSINLSCASTSDNPNCLKKGQNVACESHEMDEINDKAVHTMQQNCEKSAYQCEDLDLIPKDMNDTCPADGSNGVVSFGDLRYDAVEPLGFDFETTEEPLSLDDVPLGSPNNTDIDGHLNSTVQFGPGEVMANMVARHQFTTVCIWCGVEFNHEADYSELQSDSVGFMCPTCKAKISGQLSVMDGSSNVHAGNL